METEHPAYNNEIERKKTNNNTNNRQSNYVMRRSYVLSRQLFVSEVRSEGVTQHWPSTGPESIFMNLEDNEIIKENVEVVDVPLNEVGDEELIIA